MPSPQAWACGPGAMDRRSLPVLTPLPRPKTTFFPRPRTRLGLPSHLESQILLQGRAPLRGVLRA